MSDNGVSFALHKKIQEAKELRQQLEQAQARVAQLEVAVLNAIQAMPGGQAKADLRDAYDEDVPATAWILRKQAEAVERAKHEHALTARMPDGTAGEHFQDGFDTAAEQYDASIDRYAQRLRQQADEIEKEGGTHD